MTRRMYRRMYRRSSKPATPSPEKLDAIRRAQLRRVEWTIKFDALADDAAKRRAWVDIPGCPGWSICGLVFKEGERRIAIYCGDHQVGRVYHELFEGYEVVFYPTPREIVHSPEFERVLEGIDEETPFIRSEWFGCCERATYKFYQDDAGPLIIPEGSTLLY